MKVCKTCNQEKPLDAFSKLSKARSHHGDGHVAHCKECVNTLASSPEKRKLARTSEAARRSKPEVKVKKKETNQRYAQTEKGKQARTKAQAKYTSTRKGKAAKAKACKRYQQTEKYKEAVIKHRLKFPERRRANVAIMNALSAGEITRPDTCSVCNTACIPEGHHPDYSKPLDVIWVCHECHVAIHWRP